MSSDLYIVILRFRAIGNAPILKTPYRKVNATFTVQRVINFLRKELKHKDIDPLVSSVWIWIYTCRMTLDTIS